MLLYKELDASFFGGSVVLRETRWDMRYATRLKNYLSINLVFSINDVCCLQIQLMKAHYLGSFVLTAAKLV